VVRDVPGPRRHVPQRIGLGAGRAAQRRGLPTMSRWFGVELVPNPEQWLSRDAPVLAR
jgi:hypothetical protein